MKVLCSPPTWEGGVQKAVQCPARHILVPLEVCQACPKFKGLYLQESGVSCELEQSRQ